MKNDQRESAEVVYGRHAVESIMDGDRDINKILIQKGSNSSTMVRLLQKAKRNNNIIQYVDKIKMDKLSDGQNHQGVLAQVTPYRYSILEDVFNLAETREENCFIIILDKIKDPHNLGSILRTAEAAGVHGVIIPKRNSVSVTSTVIKISTGSSERVPVVRVSNIVSAIKKLKDRGLWIFGTDMNGTNYKKWNFKGPMGLIIGSEEKGISRLVREQVDEILTIPMAGEVQSLNAGVAAGLLMYHVFLNV